MAENQESGDLSGRLRLERHAPAPMTERLRSRGVWMAAPGAIAAAESTDTAPPDSLRRSEESVDARLSVAAHDVPVAVLVIGLCEFARSVSLAIMFGMMVADPHSHVYSDSFWMSFYILSNGAMAVTPFLPLTIIYALAIGTGLWQRMQWGRWALIASSAWAIFRLARYAITYEAFDLGANGSDMEISHLSYLRGAALVLAILNIAIGVYLAAGPEVAKAFGQKNQGQGISGRQ